MFSILINVQQPDREMEMIMASISMVMVLATWVAPVICFIAKPAADNKRYYPDE